VHRELEKTYTSEMSRPLPATIYDTKSHERGQPKFTRKVYECLCWGGQAEKRKGEVKNILEGQWENAKL